MQTIAAIIRAGLAANHADDVILAAVKAQHPTANTGVNSLRFYRNEAKKAAGAKPAAPAKKVAARATPGPIPKAAKLAPPPKTPVQAATAAIAGLTTIHGELNRGGYSARSVKTFKGMEGGGYNAVLCRDGRRVAELIDDASGGELMVHWDDHGAPRVPVTVLRFDGSDFERQGSPEEAILEKYLHTLPPLEKDADHPADQPAYRRSFDIFLDDVVNDAQTLARLRRLVKTKLVMVEDGKMFAVSVSAVTPDALARMKAKYPKGEFLNGLSAEAAVRLYNSTI